jgi:hypothetical protein
MVMDHTFLPLIFGKDFKDIQMIIKLLEIFMMGCGITFLIAVYFGVREWFIIKRIANLPIDSLEYDKKTFCGYVLEWCHQNIGHPTTKKPNLKFYNYRSKKYGGWYLSRNHECGIFIKNHYTIIQVVNTVIHEYVHARQNGPNFDSSYNQYTKELGYDDNPYEVEARTVAKKFESKCLKWVCSNKEFT